MRNVRLLSSTIATHSGLDSFVSLLVQEIRLFINIFLSSLVISFMLIGSKTTQWCICCISLYVAAVPFSPISFMPNFKLYFCRKLKSCKLGIPSKEVFLCDIVITMISADSKMYSSVLSNLACKCFQLCGGTMTLSVWRLPWLSSSSPSVSSVSSDTFLYIMAHSLSLSCLIILIQHCLLLPRKLFTVIPCFHVGPELFWLL